MLCQVYLWDLNTTAVATHLKAHDGNVCSNTILNLLDILIYYTLDAILSVASHPDPASSQFASASLDGSVKIFELSPNE